jgi:pyrroline-5-carboxylate reductase
MNKITIIGAGNMGSIIYSALIKHFDKKNIFVIDFNEDKLEALDPSNQENFSTEPEQIITESDILIFCIKPQDFSSFIYDLRVTLHDKFLISIMGGLTIDKIEHLTASQKIVRCMPNLPLSTGKGVTLWKQNGLLQKPEIDKVVEIFSLFGEAFEAKDEEEIDQIATLTSSGIAYFYFFAQSLVKKAQELGFENSESIIKQVFIGSSELLKQNSKISLSQWLDKMSYKGGVTNAGIAQLKTLEEAVSKAVDASIDRAENIKQKL